MIAARKRPLIPVDREIKIRVVRKLCQCGGWSMKKYALAESNDSDRFTSLERTAKVSTRRRFLQVWGGHSISDWQWATKE